MPRTSPVYAMHITSICHAHHQCMPRTSPYMPLTSPVYATHITSIIMPRTSPVYATHTTFQKVAFSAVYLLLAVGPFLEVLRHKITMESQQVTRNEKNKKVTLLLKVYFVLHIGDKQYLNFI